MATRHSPSSQLASAQMPTAAGVSFAGGAEDDVHVLSSQGSWSSGSTGGGFSSSDDQLPPGVLGGRYEYMKFLGRGSYGSVHQCRDTHTEKLVAIKRVTRIFRNSVTTRRILREVRILRMFAKNSHPNLIGLRDLLTTPGATKETFHELYIVFDFIPTDLQRLIHSNQNITELHVQYFMWQLLMGLAYLHNNRILHRDIKPANLLVDGNCSLWICDYGLSRNVNLPPQQPSPQASPEASSAFGICRQSSLERFGGSSLRSLRPRKKDIRSLVSEASEEKTQGPSTGASKRPRPSPEADEGILEGGMSPSHQEIRDTAEEAIAPPPKRLRRTLSDNSELKISDQQSSLSSEDENDDDDFADIPPPSKLRRQLTRHVVTRYYRAPELILLAAEGDSDDEGIHAADCTSLQPMQGNGNRSENGSKREGMDPLCDCSGREESSYTTAVDIWSAGCVFAELLGMLVGSHMAPHQRVALFPGKSCYPLSASEPTAYKDAQDQLNVICNVIGTPGEADMEFLKNENLKRYLRSLPYRPKIDLRRKYNLDSSGIDLLNRMLSFNPKHRITAEEALRHEWFSNTKFPKAPTKSNAEAPYFDFDDLKEVTESDFRDLLWEQITYEQAVRERRRRNSAAGLEAKRE